MSDLHEAFQTQKQREEEERLAIEEMRAKICCEKCKKVFSDCQCSRHTGLGWLETESSGV